jgi:hypothetical protein
VIKRMMMLATLVLLLTGCGHAVVMRNPETGEVAQCNIEAGLGSFGQTIANQVCVDAYERVGWERE